MPQSLITIPARRGKAAFVAAGQEIKVINTHGQQVVDTWAFNRADQREFMSMEHTRADMLRLVPHVNDTMLTNRRRPILTFVDDTWGGVHDMLIAACDRYRYEQLGHKGKHENCTDNLVDALRELGLEAPAVPAPLNLFMNVPWTRQGDLSLEVPDSNPGGFVVLRAEMDLAIVFSACPQDMIPINGEAMKPTEAHFEVLG
jgi:uncharacterized protein YcgI (DUF1989 family)